MVSNITIQFARLHAGRDDAYGRGRGGVVHERVTLDHYQRHLNGEGDGIGIFPLRDDGTVSFGAIDLDEPDFELARSMQPLIPGASWIERSRSGNAHIWTFFAQPAPAWAVRAVLFGATEGLGRPDVEIFPKQDRVRPGGVGNYLNLSYHGDDRPVLTTFEGRPSGPGELIELPLHHFVETASRAEHLHDPATWEARARRLGAKPPEEREAADEWGESPVLHECAEYIITNALDGSNPLRPGHRHEVLFHLSCQLLNYHDFDATEARELIDQVNAAAARSLPRHEVDGLFSNAQEGRYTFTGCDQPVMAPYVSPTCPIAASGGADDSSDDMLDEGPGR